MSQTRPLLALLALLALLTCAACGEDAPADPTTPARDMSADLSPDAEPPAEDMPPDGADLSPDADMEPVQEAFPAEDCDPLDPSVCSYPWPSNLYLKPDATRATGYTLTFGRTTLPERTNTGRFANPAPFERLDGYGLGTALQVIFPEIDASQLAGEYTIERSVEPDAPIVWLQITEAGVERVPYWAELDQTVTDPQAQTLFVRPAVILEEGARQVVAFRELKTTSGAPIQASSAFAALRDASPHTSAAVERRRARYDEIFSILAAQRVERSSLTLAWDFYTASSDALHGPMLSMRDQGMAAAGERGPELTVTNVQSFNREEHPHIALQIDGTMRAPNFMRQVAGGWRMSIDAETGLPKQNEWRETPFMVRVPHAALDGTPQGLITYGHGLLGARSEIRAGHIGLLADTYNYIIVAVDLAGMSAEDSTTAQLSVTDIDRFISIGDRLHQGLLDHLLISRAARERLQDLDAISERGIVIDKTRQYYFGASQGGIFGASFLAISQEITRGFLAVPGNNYNIMLQRSTNFNAFSDGIRLTYRDPTDIPVILAVLQLHWDRTDPISYIRRLKQRPFPQTPPHEAIFAVAKGDHQVSVITNEHAARTLGADLPVVERYDVDRQPWGVQTASYPHEGSALILFDFGNPWPMNGNRPPDDGLRDPHSRQAEVPAAGDLMITFFEQGKIIDICSPQGCLFGR